MGYIKLHKNEVCKFARYTSCFSLDITLPDTIVLGCAKIDIAPIIKKREPKLILCNCLFTMNTYNSKFLIFENAKVRKKKRGNNHLI